jgi:hypothetical protein
MVYFHLDNGDTVLDGDGFGFRDMAAARAEALATVADILRDGDLSPLWEGTPLRLWVTDRPGGLGKTLFTLHLAATVVEQTLGATENVASLEQARRGKTAG